MLAGIERTHSVRQDGKAALLLEDLQQVLPAGEDLLAIRDRAGCVLAERVRIIADAPDAS